MFCDYCVSKTKCDIDKMSPMDRLKSMIEMSRDAQSVRARQISSTKSLVSVSLMASFSIVDPTKPTLSECRNIAGIKCDHSKTSPILFAGNMDMDKLIVINHGEVPICEKCKHYIDTYILFEPEFIINTGSMINVPFNIIQLPFNI
jgi:hypothetical protein